MERRTHVRYGWKPSLPDARDLLADPSGIAIAGKVDPRPQMPPVYDQGQLGSCTANAVAGAVEYDLILSKKSFGTPSRLDIYYGEREIEGTTGEDSGAFGRDGFKFAHTTGVIPEKDWPYNISRFAKQPPADAKNRHKIGAYKAVPRSVASFKQVLSNRQTIALGFTVYESFESEAVAKTGVMPIPAHGEQVLGGHEVLGIGYIDDQYLLCRNSWSAGWGLAGYFLMPWAVVLSKTMSDDFRTIYRPLGK